MLTLSHALPHTHTHTLTHTHTHSLTHSLVKSHTRNTAECEQCVTRVTHTHVSQPVWLLLWLARPSRKGGILVSCVRPSLCLVGFLPDDVTSSRGCTTATSLLRALTCSRSAPSSLRGYAYVILHGDTCACPRLLLLCLEAVLPEDDLL